MINRVVAHYRIEALAGEGGAGQVFRARDTNLDRPVALKFLRPALATDPAALERFLQEARIAATLDDSHVCTIHAIDRDDEGAWYIAMNWYDGGALDLRLAEGPVEPRQALAWVRQAALGLAEAHRHGIVHRDIKPANLILDDKQSVRILDFGIARLQDTERRTRAGSLTGTVAYMAPEQARGEEGGPAADIWAAGVVLYELLAGCRPFSGAYDAALLFDIVHGTPAPLPATVGPLRDRCQRIVDRCLAKDPGDRYRSADALAADLQVLLTEEGTGPRQRWRRMVPAAAALLLVASLGARFGPAWLQALRIGDPPARGVVVLPVTFNDPAPGSAALGIGLGWYLAEQLTRVEHHSGAFWIVPPGQTGFSRVRTESQAQEAFGVRRTLFGNGRLDGELLTVDFTFHDAADGRHVSRRFSDDVANLRTWQLDVPMWAAGVLDPQLARRPPPEFSAPSTTVPAAFMAWLAGVGRVWSPAAMDADSVLRQGEAWLAEAVRQDSSYACARAEWVYTGFRLRGRSDPAAAARALDDLLFTAEHSPLETRASLYGAAVAAEMGRHEQALAFCDRVLAVDPVNHGALSGKARALAALDSTAAAAAWFERALGLRPGYAPLLVQAGLFWYGVPDYDRVRRIAERTVQVTPGNDFAWVLLGAALFELDDLRSAELAFHQAIAIKPGSSALLNLGTIAYYEGRFADAAHFYRRALALGESREGWKQLGEAWRWLPGHADSSRAAYGKAVALGSAELAQREGDWDLVAELATYHTAVGAWAAADSLLAEIERAAPSLGSGGMFELAVVYEDLGRRELALVWLERALAGGLPILRPQRYPGFRNLRNDSRYRDLAARYGGKS
ncbi:MAG: protein kinase [Krumholzibacteria bacterium]|nr:protein kinase [Candidatus Krumholzibacteria bacterium]